jgi:hypothetical protein
VVVLRCTQRLLRRLRTVPGAEPRASDTRLGDWYANLVHVGRQQFVLAVSSRTFLPVVVAAAPISTLEARLRAAACDVIQALGIPAAEVERELEAMSDVVYAKTASRQVLGVMNDLAYALSFHVGRDTLGDISLRLAETPLSPLYKNVETSSPDRATVALFGGAPVLRGVH